MTYFLVRKQEIRNNGYHTVNLFVMAMLLTLREIASKQTQNQTYFGFVDAR